MKQKRNDYKGNCCFANIKCSEQIKKTYNNI